MSGRLNEYVPCTFTCDRMYGDKRATSSSNNVVAFGSELFDGEVDVVRVPQHDAVDDEPERSELILHAFVVALEQFALATVQDALGEGVAAFLEVADSFDVASVGVAVKQSSMCIDLKIRPDELVASPPLGNSTGMTSHATSSQNRADHEPASPPDPVPSFPRARHDHRTRCAVSLADCVVAEVARAANAPVATSNPHLLDVCHAENIAFPRTSHSRSSRTAEAGGGARQPDLNGRPRPTNAPATPTTWDFDTGRPCGGSLTGFVSRIPRSAEPGSTRTSGHCSGVVDPECLRADTDRQGADRIVGVAIALAGDRS